MNRLKKFMIGALTAGMLLGAGVYASENTGWSCSVEPDFSNNCIIAKGVSAANTTITAMVLPQGKKPADVWSLSAKTNKTAVGLLADGSEVNLKAEVGNPAEVLVYTSQFKTGADGSFSSKFGVSDSGTYDVYLLSADTNKIYEYLNIDFSNARDYSAAVDKLNEKINNKAEFIELFSDAQLMTTLGFKSVTNAESAAEILFAQLNGKPLSYNYGDNRALYLCCAETANLNAKASADMDILLYAVRENADFMTWYNKYIKDEKAKKYLTDTISGKKIATVDKLSDELTGALILYVVENPNGYENIKEIFGDFPNITGISSPTDKNSVYSSLAGQKIQNITALVTRYNELVNSASSPGAGGSGTGGGSGGGNRGRSVSAGSGMEIPGNQVEAAKPMNTDIFEDLDSVPWAKDAVIELASKNVIAGKGDNKFCPNDMITREEFTKLVASAFLSDVDGVKIAFNDVPADRWSHQYIAKAKAAGIINGYSDTEFGAGDLILRQDMAVIIHNAAVYKNVTLASAGDALTFADDSQIAEYAKESVYTLKAMGIINGVSDMDFAPLKNATRAEAAMIIYALLRK
ncbi:MAG: S-layer homology domain-containing protein [Clostridia bacterium]|nr:S-layer homology domain-containing protein [Clostridia bacterium]